MDFFDSSSKIDIVTHTSSMSKQNYADKWIICDWNNSPQSSVVKP